VNTAAMTATSSSKHAQHTVQATALAQQLPPCKRGGCMASALNCDWSHGCPWLPASGSVGGDDEPARCVFWLQRLGTCMVSMLRHRFCTVCVVRRIDMQHASVSAMHAERAYPIS
jgi:hypothetical protein